MWGGGGGGALMMSLLLAEVDGAADGVADADGGGAVEFTVVGTLTVSVAVGVAVALTCGGSEPTGSGEFTDFGVSLQAAARVPKPTSAAPWESRVSRSNR